MLVGREAVVGAGLDEHGTPFADGNVLSLHLEDAGPLEHDVELVVLVRLLPVRLRCDEDVHTDLEARGRVDNLVAAAGVDESLLDRGDLERVHAGTLLQRPQTMSLRTDDVHDKVNRTDRDDEPDGKRDGTPGDKRDQDEIHTAARSVEATRAASSTSRFA